ncbi:MAG: acetyl-CoA synthetase [Dehalococcoidia bacterium]|nr:MAG: acetyl-CoA synthetase [Dehalococcoidia bacterium]
MPCPFLGMRDGMMSLKEQLDYLFNPRSVAVIGASNQLGKWGYFILARLLESKSGKEIYAINKKEAEVLGLKAYRSVVDVPGPVDLVVITVPFQGIIDVMHDCVRKGVKAAIVITSGLAETGGEGASMEQEMVEVARRGGMRIVGPNCLGHLDTYSNVRTVGFLPGVKKGGAALISQSGNSSQSVTNYAGQMGLGFSKFVSSGNEADLHFEDYLEYLAQDDKTKVILGYIEGFREGRRFLELAKEITKKKPIVIMKAGRTDAGVRAAQSHTASLAGSDMVLDAAFRQCGVIRVEEISELVDVAVPLLGQPLPRGRGVGVVALGGGMAVMAADAVRREGLEMPAFSPATMEKLNSIMSHRWSRGNPVDPGGDNVSYEALWPMLEDENIDAIIIVGGVGMISGFRGWVVFPSSIKSQLAEARKRMEDAEIINLDKTMELIKKHQKPILFVTHVTGAARGGEAYKKLKENQLSFYSNPERAARTLKHLVEYSEYLGVARGS